MKKIFILLAAVCAMTMSAETFVKVTDAATLQDGDKVVMAYATASKVSAGFSDTKKFISAMDAVFANDSVTVTDPTEITLKKSGSYWNLYIGTKPVGHASGSSDLDTKFRYTTNYAITIESNGIAKIVSQTPGKNNNEVYFRYNAGNPRFNVYASSSTAADITLYKLDESTVAVTSVALSPTEAVMRVEDVLNLKTTVLPDNAVDKTLAWGSTDETIATVADGVVTAVAKGTVKIWVKATAVENVSDTCYITVLPKAAEGDATYNAARSAAHLTEGAKVFFGTIKAGKDFVMGQYVSGDNNIKGTAATYDETRHSVTAPLQVAYTVHIEDGKYTFEDHDGYYLRTISTSKLGSGDNDQYAKWTLGAFDATDATVVLTASNGNGIYFNHPNNLFNIYSSVGDGSNLAYIVIYSDQAPAWPNPGTGVENTSVEMKAQKVIRNGQILIIRGGAVYTITGVKVE